MYKTYSAYKAHVYRQHRSELQSKNKPNNDPNITRIPCQQQENMNNLFVELETINTDDDTSDTMNDDFEPVLIDDDWKTDFCNVTSSFDAINSEQSISDLLVNMKRSYLLFLLELREEYLLPQGVTNIISTYIATLIHHLQVLLEKRAFFPPTDIHSSLTSSLQQQNQKIIEIFQVHKILNDCSNIIESISKNNYQFIKNCEKYFDYNSPEQIVLSAVDETVEYAYYLPIDKTLSSMLKSQQLLS